MLCAHGWAGQTQFPFWRRISQGEIRKIAAAKKETAKARAGKNSFPPNPLPFCPPERSVSTARSAAISQSFVQKRFELRSVIATNQDILKIEGHLVARSPRLRRVSLRKKPCISELNRKVGQIQIQFFGKANGGSAGEARNKQSLFPIFSIPPEAEYKASFLNPALLAKGD